MAKMETPCTTLARAGRSWLEVRSYTLDGLLTGLERLRDVMALQSRALPSRLWPRAAQSLSINCRVIAPTCTIADTNLTLQIPTVDTVHQFDGSGEAGGPRGCAPRARQLTPSTEDHMNETALGLVAVGKNFGVRKVLDGINLDLPAGAIIGLVGPACAGKTTLFSIVAGLLRADCGRISILGHVQHGMRRQVRQVGIQDARFIGDMPVRKHLIWYARIKGFGRTAAAAEADRVLDLVNLRRVALAPVSTLSRGTCKCMAVAQAFIGDPAIVLLDEPTAGLDSANAQTLQTLIREQRGRRLVLLSSRKLEEVSNLCDYVNMLNKGKLVDSGLMTNARASAPDSAPPSHEPHSPA